MVYIDMENAVWDSYTLPRNPEITQFSAGDMLRQPVEKAVESVHNFLHKWSKNGIRDKIRSSENGKFQTFFTKMM